MILQIDNNNNFEKSIVEASFIDLNLYERKNMQEWIVKCPDILGEPLEIITTEFDKFNNSRKRLDVLAIDREGRIVIIELKRDTEKYQDLQAIHYASFCSNMTFDEIKDELKTFSEKQGKKMDLDEIDRLLNNFITDNFGEQDPRIILVANNFSNETITSVLWLNKFGVNIKCVKLIPYKLEDKILIKSEIIIPLPEAEEYIIRTQKKDQISKEKSEKLRNYKNFWSKFLEELNKKKPDITNKTPPSKNYLDLPTGNSKYFFTLYYNKEGEFKIAIYLRNQTEEEKIETFKKIQSDISGIRQNFDRDFVFAPDDALKIYIKLDTNELNDEILKWALDEIIKFYNHIKPILEKYYN